ncbi:MAG: hypothetical protein H5T74_10885 [Actinobacteria bacterium]|nr:hypothetical protein [Actinomycetota bacterium]MDI6830895.1 hypothetical protein [Actinomycetota bacterium]
MQTTGSEKHASATQNEARTSFFTRKLASKLRERGQTIPASVMVFLDTPLCLMDERQRAYFEEKFRPLIPGLAAVLEEVYVQMGADAEGWEDMLTFSSRSETPITICARAVLARKERQAREESLVKRGIGLETRRITLPPDLARV